jgi:beta-lactamase class A
MMRVLSSFPIFLLFALTGTVSAADAHRELLAGKFQQHLDVVAREMPGVLGIAVIDLDGERTFGVNADMVFPQGSAIKVAILVTMFVRQSGGELDLDRSIPVVAADRVGGSGFLRHFGDGSSSLSLHDLAVLMITVSDNMATNILIDQVGMEHVNAVMAELGLNDIRLQRRMIRQEQSARGNENLATPRQAAALMARILRCDLPIGKDECAGLQAILAIPHDGPIEDGTPGGPRLLQKSGSIDGVRTSWGAVDLEGRPYALAVMGNYGDTEGITENIEAVAELSHWYFSRLAGATDYGTRVPVELLQRVRNE